MDYQIAIGTIFHDLKEMDDPGEVATYIPELAGVDAEKFGVHLTTLNNQHFSIGDSDEKFSIQSIAKVLSLTFAYKLEGDYLWQRMGVEPSGAPFNSLTLLEYNNGIPRNPMINSGAIVVCDILISHCKNPKTELIEFIRSLTGNKDIHYSKRVAESEKKTGHRNSSLIYLMKAFGNIENDIEEVLDLYFNLCSIEMTCRELASTFLYLAGYGNCPYSEERIISVSKSKRINAIMQLCGMYDEAGEFSFRTGLPGKSGVGGGIVAVCPNQYSIAVWSPKLNPNGNSFKGMEFLERFTTVTESSIF
ncbi:glutaminase [Rhodohalobacter sp. 8-1]|uniref:glutaminase n=1 Tax=Rhodohalobacter sp. 8-1 TaxID=3131972 RepID=UPI0030EB26A6